MSINKIAATLTQTEIDLAQYCLAYALQAGAQKVRITLSKSLMNLIGLLNGEVDKTAHALDHFPPTSWKRRGWRSSSGRLSTR